MAQNLHNSGFIWAVRHYGDLQKDGYYVMVKLVRYDSIDWVGQWLFDHKLIPEIDSLNLVEIDFESFVKDLQDALKSADCFPHKALNELLKIQEKLRADQKEHYTRAYLIEQF